MRRLVSVVIDDFRRQGKAERRLTSILLIGITVYAAGVIALWLLA